MKPYHSEYADGKWFTLTLEEQLGNTGSEVERTFRARERGDTRQFDAAFARALELFDLTLADSRWRGPRRREIARAREEFCGLALDTKVDGEAVRRVQEYFLQFAFQARAGR